MEFCRERDIYAEFGGCPNFSKCTLLSPSQPPFLMYRVVTISPQDSEIHYGDLRRANQFSSDNGQPIVGIQMFYYGVGQMAVRIEDCKGEVVMSSGMCGQLTLSPTKSPIISMEFGQKDSNYRLVGLTNSINGFIVEVKMCLVANS